MLVKLLRFWKLGLGFKISLRGCIVNDGGGRDKINPTSADLTNFCISKRAVLVKFFHENKKLSHISKGSTTKMRVIFSLALLVVGTFGRGGKRTNKKGSSTSINVDSDRLPGFYLVSAALTNTDRTTLSSNLQHLFKQSCSETIVMSDYAPQTASAVCDYGFDVPMSKTAYNSLPEICKPTAIQSKQVVIQPNVDDVYGSKDIKIMVLREIPDSQSLDPNSEEGLLDGLQGAEAGYFSALYLIKKDESGSFPSVITEEDWELEAMQIFLENYQESSKFPLVLHFEQPLDASTDVSLTDRGCQGEWHFAADERYDVGASAVVENLFEGAVVALVKMELVKVVSLPTSVGQAQRWCDDRRARLGGIFD